MLYSRIISNIILTNGDTMSENKNGQTLVFNNGEILENIPSAIVITGNSSLTPRAYYLLDVFAKKLMKHLLTTRDVNENIIDYLSGLKALRTVSITVEEYASKVGLRNFYIAQDRLTQAGFELNSFFTSYNSTEPGPISVKLKEDEESPTKIGFLQNLSQECKVFEGSGTFELEFNPKLAEFLIKKYRSEEYAEFKAEDYTSDMLIMDLILLGLSYIENHGFEVIENFPKNPEELGIYIKNNYILGSNRI